MNTYRNVTVMAIALVTLLMVAPAQAQSRRMVFDAPFEFRAGASLFPAGRYVIDRVGSHTVLLRGKTAQAFVDVRITSAGPMGGGPTARFERHSGKAHLVSVRLGD